MNRYELTERGDSTLTECEDGEYVRFVDVAAEFAELQAQIATLESVNAKWCKTIARLRDDLTATNIERDNAIRDAKHHYAQLEILRKGVKALEATWQKLLEAGL